MSKKSIRFGWRALSLVNELKTDYQILRNTHISFSYARRKNYEKDADMAIICQLGKTPDTHLDFGNYS